MKNILIDKLYVDNPNININIDIFIELLNSIEQEGIIQPILVMKDKNKYKIIDGNKRYFAACILDLQRIKCNIIERKDLEDYRKISSVNRIFTNPIEYSKNLWKMFKFYPGLTVEELAYKIGKTPEWINNKLMLTRLPILNPMISN